jgi:hypothetical protein
MKKRQHKILVTSRDKEMTNYLLDAYNINHISISSIGNNYISLGKELIIRTLRFLKLAKKFDPDILIGFNGPTIAPVGKLIRTPSIVFYDTEHAKITNSWVYPMATKIITPDSYEDDLGKKHIKFNGFCELAYLHPDYYKPDRKIIDFLNIEKNEKYVLIRFVSWQAVHDAGKERMSIQEKKKLVDLLSKKYKVFISSESSLPFDLIKYKLDIPFEKIHDVLYFSELYVGDGASMASEAALLGIPTIYTSSLSLGYLNKLEKEYGLVFNIPNPKKAIDKADEFLQKRKGLKQQWQYKRNKMLKKNIDVTKFMVNTIEKIKRD